MLHRSLRALDWRSLLRRALWFAWYVVLAILGLVISAFIVVAVWNAVVPAQHIAWPYWTGFEPYTPPPGVPEGYQREKTLYDWLQLLIIPVVLAIAGFWYNRTEKRIEQKIATDRAVNDQKLADERAANDRTIAEEQRQDTMLQAYFDRIEALLLPPHNLRESLVGSPVRDMARVRTLTAFRQLDATRRNVLLRFLRDARLVAKDGDTSIIDFRKADLSGVDLRETNLSQLDLSNVNLTGAKLQRAQMRGTRLHEAILTEAQLQGTELRDARLHAANLYKAQMDEANLFRAQLQKAMLREVQLRKATLLEAQLQGAYLMAAQLQGADLSAAQLQGADLTGAHLQGAELIDTQLQQADLSGAQLQEAVLSLAALAGANLTSTDITIEQIRQVKNYTHELLPPEIQQQLGG